MPRNTYILAGLGNPGRQYAKTRHNVGAWLVDLICGQHQLNWEYNKKFQSYCASIKGEQSDLILLKPAVYMNQSGQAVAAACHYFKVPVEALTVAHDELDFPPGRIRHKIDGGHGGHNGLRDIIQKLGASGFRRLRIGIGHPGHSSQVIAYVLKQPSKDDEKRITTALQDCSALLPKLFSGQSQEQQNAVKELHTRTS